MKIRMQIAGLYALKFLTAFGLAQAVWVALLAQRGFSLTQIGAAEGFFHLVSFLCEVPSGMAADLLGRRRTLTAACLVRALGALYMASTGGFAGVLCAMGLNAFSYNLLSGTREAITYDSLLQANRAGEYEKVAARQSGIYRTTAALCALSTPLTALIGWRCAYLADGAAALLAAGSTVLLKEPVSGDGAPGGGEPRVWRRLRLQRHIAQSIGFLRQNPLAACKMLADGATGCCAALGVMLLQQHMAQLGLGTGGLGFPLLLISMCGAFGAAFAPHIRLSFFHAAVLCFFGAGAAVSLAGAPFLPAAVLGGVMAAFWEGVMEIKTSARLNRDFPSGQRATLVSVQSMCYSMLMLPVSPLAGSFCQWFGTGAGIMALGVSFGLCALIGCMLYRRKVQMK